VKKEPRENPVGLCDGGGRKEGDSGGGIGGTSAVSEKVSVGAGNAHRGGSGWTYKPRRWPYRRGSGSGGGGDPHAGLGENEFSSYSRRRGKN